MLLKRWEMAQPNKSLAAELAENCELHPFLSLLLTAQGLSAPEEAMAFLTGSEEEVDPFAFVDMDKAVERIRRALDQHERILVFGDYDVDGITATVAVYTYLKDRGADVLYRVPLRDSGYGLHAADVAYAAEQQVKLIVTVDTGISLSEEIDLAAAAGIELVITDHHQPPVTLPAAVAVVDPYRTDCESVCGELAGVGVAFMLLCALEGDGEFIFARYGDLLALGTLADAIPLRGFARDLIRRGVSQLNSDTRPGIVALRRLAGCDKQDMTASTVSFLLVPRLNACGRMRDPDLAARLLMAEDEKMAQSLAQELQECNTQRQTVSAAILKQAQEKLDQHPEWLSDRVFVLSGKGWHDGILGIVASRIADQYGKPVFILSEKEDGTAHGSGRSLIGFSLYEALSECSSLFLTFGGHEQAAGISLSASKVDAFRLKINDYAARHYPRMPMSTLSVAFRLRPDQIDMEKVALLQLLEPFGNGNPAPLFGLFNMRLDNITALGNGAHMRLSLSRDNVRISAVRFGVSPTQFPVPCGSVVNCVVALDKSEYRGNVSVSIRVKDISYADTDREQLLEDMLTFESMMRRECRPAADVCLPTHEQLARLYSLFHRCKEWSGTLEQLLYAVCRAGNGEEILSMTALQLLAALQIWQECSLIAMSDLGELLRIKLLPTSAKADLTATPLWRFIERGE